MAKRTIIVKIVYDDRKVDKEYLLTSLTGESPVVGVIDVQEVTGPIKQEHGVNG